MKKLNPKFDPRFCYGSHLRTDAPASSCPAGTPEGSRGDGDVQQELLRAAGEMGEYF